jgi:hypothetical protein
VEAAVQLLRVELLLGVAGVEEALKENANVKKNNYKMKEGKKIFIPPKTQGMRNIG